LHFHRTVQKAVQNCHLFAFTYLGGRTLEQIAQSWCKAVVPRSKAARCFIAIGPEFPL